jgi:hypothetical protein
VCAGNRNTVIAYYLTAKQYALAWDGVAPIKMPFAKITAAALNETHRRGVRPAAVKEMRLSAQRFADRWYYFWTVNVCHEGDASRYETTEVLVDLAGEVIERQVKHFDEPNWKKRNAASQAFADALPQEI